MRDYKIEKIELNRTQKNLVYNSVHMLRHTLQDAVDAGIRSAEDKLLVSDQTLVSILFHLKYEKITPEQPTIFLEIDEYGVDLIIHAMYAYIQVMFGMVSAEDYLQIDSDRIAVWDKIRSKFDVESDKGESV